MRIGERVAALRRVQGATQFELAERSGVSLSMVRAVERGAKHPGEATLARIAAALGVPLATLTNEKPAADVQEVIACILPLPAHHLRLIVALCNELAKVPVEAE